MGYDGSIVCPDEWQSFCHEPSILNYGSPLPSPSPPDGGGGSDDGGGASLLDTISHAQQKYPGCTETRSWDQILTPSTPTGGMGKWMVMGTFEVWREREKGMDGWREGERQCSGGIHIHDFHFSFDSLSSSFSLCSRARARAPSLSLFLSLSLCFSLSISCSGRSGSVCMTTYAQTARTPFATPSTKLLRPLCLWASTQNSP
jgi:hypothetical protein